MKSKTYRLKAMVMARALAELTVLVILFFLPMSLCFKPVQNLQFFIKAAICLLSPVSAFVLWRLLKTPFQVTVSEAGLSLRSLIQKKTLLWSQIRTIRLARRLAWPEFVLELEASSLSFPALLASSSELLESIRERLPNRGKSQIESRTSIFKISAQSLFADITKICFQIILLAVFLCFCFWQKGSASSSNEDLLIIFSAAALFAAALGWRLFQFLSMPVFLQFKDGSELEMKTLSGIKKTLDCRSLDKFSKTGSFYPEGIFLFAGKKRVLISASFDAFDELAEELSRKTGLQI